MKSSDNERVLFCDNHILVAYKPAGMLTQPDASANESLEAFAKDWVKKEFQKQGNVFLHAIHRLDRPVSGLVLFAKTSKALSRLNEQQRDQEIQRIYIAEVEGILPHKLGQLDHFLIHGDHRAIVGKEGQEGAKHARLKYEVLAYLPQSTVVRVELETGRYHQIRAQFATIGHPILGDKKYGSKNVTSETIRLHCAQMSFKHPVTEEIVTFESAAPFG